MAGSTVTLTRKSNFRGLARDIIRELAYLSDAADGHVPDQDLLSLDDCILTEYSWDPDGSDTPANTFRLQLIDKATSRKVFDTGTTGVAADAFGLKMATALSGNFPRIDGIVTIKLVDPATEAACNIGNAKKGTLILRFEKKS